MIIQDILLLLRSLHTYIHGCSNRTWGVLEPDMGGARTGHGHVRFEHLTPFTTYATRGTQVAAQSTDLLPGRRPNPGVRSLLPQPFLRVWIRNRTGLELPAGGGAAADITRVHLHRPHHRIRSSAAQGSQPRQGGAGGAARSRALDAHRFAGSAPPRCRRVRIELSSHPVFSPQMGGRGAVWLNMLFL